MERLHQPWSEIMNMYYYDIQNIFKSYENILEERRKHDEEESKKNGYDDTKYNTNTMMKQFQSSIPKVPNIQIPKF